MTNIQTGFEVKYAFHAGLPSSSFIFSMIWSVTEWVRWQCVARADVTCCSLW